MIRDQINSERNIKNKKQLHEKIASNDHGGVAHLDLLSQQFTCGSSEHEFSEEEENKSCEENSSEEGKK